ncbi:hypothetical protein MNBD_IGNAVI01-497 [hydrothermal vent metagenome]|uniref:Uncharacterized protein n=1 Tax=hydrothermal vent metagenome TaxID=652676 RepID=A0A3B1C9J2_9ZZZZ
MKKLFLIKNLTNEIIEFDNLVEAEKRFLNFSNSTELIEKDKLNNEKVIKSRTHKKVGQIEINNKCVYIKVPFFQPSDKPEIKISKIGESPKQLRSKMDVIDEVWE